MHGLIQLDSPPTALFTSHYLITLGAIRALHDLQLEQRIALIGFDDIMLADLVSPAITVMAAGSEPGSARSRQSALFARLDGDTSPCRPSSSRRSSSPAVQARSRLLADNSCVRRGSRAALSYTDERADTLFACESERKAAAS